MRTKLLFAALAGVALACSSKPPPHWESGGATLSIAQARWQRSNGDVVELLADGTVLEDGRKVFLVDSAGRIVDKRNEPLALLLPSGIVAGPDDANLGHVGVNNAAPPGSASAWLSVLPDGQVVRFDEDGDRKPDGAWTGCQGPVQRTCTLVTHMLAMRRYRDRSEPRFGVGIGFVF